MAAAALLGSVRLARRLVRVPRLRPGRGRRAGRGRLRLHLGARRRSQPRSRRGVVGRRGDPRRSPRCASPTPATTRRGWAPAAARSARCCRPRWPAPRSPRWSPGSSPPGFPGRQAARCSSRATAAASHPGAQPARRHPLAADQPGQRRGLHRRPPRRRTGGRSPWNSSTARSGRRPMATPCARRRAPWPMSRVRRSPRRITIDRLGGKLVPAAFAPVSTRRAAYADDTADLGRARRGRPAVRPGDRADLGVAPIPSPAELRLATVGQAPRPSLYDLPDDFPDEAARLASRSPPARPTPYDQARRPAELVPRPSSPTTCRCRAGHGDDADPQLPAHPSRGYCEQFAATFAAMARSLGLPARVAVGFTPGELRDRRAVPRVRPPRPRLARGVVRRHRLGQLRADAGPRRARRGAAHRRRRGAGRHGRHGRWPGAGGPTAQQAPATTADAGGATRRSTPRPGRARPPRRSARRWPAPAAAVDGTPWMLGLAWSPPCRVAARGCRVARRGAGTVGRCRRPSGCVAALAPAPAASCASPARPAPAGPRRSSTHAWSSRRSASTTDRRRAGAGR